jgi:hypothetical protein
MTLPITETLAFQSVERFTFSEVAKLCELSHGETQDLIDYGAIESVDTQDEECIIFLKKISILQSACKQRRDYDLDLFSVVICVQYLEQIADLNHQIESLQALSRS